MAIEYCSDYFHRQSTGHLTTLLEEQGLYDHLLACVRVESPEELLVRFRALFVNAIGYSDAKVWQSLGRLVDSPFIEKDFKFILNRCCHILINHWLMQPRHHDAIPTLVHLIELVPDSPGCSRTTKRLRQLVRQFGQTEQYAALKRLAQVVNRTTSELESPVNKPLGTLIHRYPCLYDHSLLTEDSTDEERHRVRRIRRHAQRQFECDLARYATYQMQIRSVNPRGLILTGNAGARSSQNPTLLSDRRLDAALRQFGGKMDGRNTYRDLAQHFITYSSQAPCYRHFKYDLYDYLTEAIDPKYGRRQFNARLCDFLQNTLPEQDDQVLNDVLLVGTCRKLLNFLIIENQQQPNHAIFVDLLGNLGVSWTIGLLLKVLLICRTVKPYLEKQFATLFKHYESYTGEGILWLVESLEHLNVAFSVHFGTLSLCQFGLQRVD